MRAAFTLIELLVVIAIIAVLASMLLPVLGQARERSRQSACMNNMKQIALASELYVSDFDDFYSATQLWQQLPMPTCNGWRG